MLPVAMHCGTLKGHTRDITSLAFNRDGRTLASGGDDLTIKLWDAASGRQLVRLISLDAQG